MRLASLLGLAILVSLAPSARGAQLRPVPEIVFASNRHDGDLVVLRRDGTHARVVTRSVRNDESPAWSPDGRHIAFTEADSSRTWVAVLNLRTGRVRRLAEGWSPDWSPDGGRIVFVTSSNSPDLATMAADGTDIRLLGVNELAVHGGTRPAWSPRGARIAFVTRLGLHLVDADGSRVRSISRKGRGGGAAWSPSGALIAYDCAVERFAVCSVRPDGSGLRGLTPKGHLPAWSPRGDLIALTSYHQIATILVRPNGRYVRTLPGGLDVGPDWSPDGKSLVVSRAVGLGARLYAASPEGRTLTRLTTGDLTNDSAPAWSPSGRLIAFRRQLQAHCSLEVLEIRSGRLRRLARGGLIYCSDRPDWSPNGRTILYAMRGELWVVSPRGGRPRRITRTRRWESSPRWAPDGRSIGYVARGGIWLRDPKGRRSLLVPGGQEFAWSHDGRMLAYTAYESPTAQSALFVKAGDEPARRIFDPAAGPLSWSPADDRIAFVHTNLERGTSTIAITDLSGNGGEIFGQDAADPDWRG